MALQVQTDNESISRAIVTAHNAARREYVATETTYPHADITSTPTGDYTTRGSTPFLVASATPTTTATLRTISREIYHVVSIHLVDALAHLAADATNVVTEGLPTDADQTALNTFLNEVKAVCNAHALEPGVHFTDDAVNAIVAADATDASSSYTLAAAIKTFINAHLQFSPTAPAIKLG